MADAPFDSRKFVNAAQVGGIESYLFGDGPGRGSRVLWVNTGGGLRYRILVDRGFDIDQAFFNQHSLAFLSHKGPAAPSRALDRGIDWLKGFPGGLLTSCGPTNIGPPVIDDGQELGLHGPHSNTPADLESVIRPDPHRGQLSISASATVRYGSLFGPNLRLRRSIASVLGQNSIRIVDEFLNDGNTPAPHAWLLHINFGYPLIDEGTLLCYDARVEARDDPASQAHFRDAAEFKRIGGPIESHRGSGEAVAYLYPRAAADGSATVGVVNEKLSIGVAIRYDTRHFPRCANWQHLGPGEYVTALEPMNGTVAGRDKDRAAGLLDLIPPGGSRQYPYQIEVLTEPEQVDALLKLNRRDGGG